MNTSRLASRRMQVVVVQKVLVSRVSHSKWKITSQRNLVGENIIMRRPFQCEDIKLNATYSDVVLMYTDFLNTNTLL